MVETNVYYPGDILLDQELHPGDDISSLLSFVLERQATAEILRVVIYRQITEDTEHKLQSEYKEEEVSDKEEPDPDPDLPASDEENLAQISDTSAEPKIIRFRLSDEKLEKKGRKPKEKKDPNVQIMCEECGKNVRAKYLKFHQRRCGKPKTEWPSYFCPHENCVYQCRAKTTLENHINSIHLGKESRYKCIKYVSI